jgi:imidazolonepropionase-like amidohydrolase
MGTALTNATVVTCAGEGPIADGAVVIQGERLAWVGPAAGLPPGHDVVDCAGRTIIPGLCDAHVHLVYDFVKDTYDIELARPLEQAAVDAAVNAAKLLELGFTCGRDVGTRGNIAVVVRDAVAAGRLPGPRLKASQQIISVWGGLGDFHPTHLFRREQYAAALTELVTGPWEARRAVRKQVKDGVNWIKAEASGTGFNPVCPADRDTMSFEELQAVCEEAADKGKPVACHAESRGSIVKAARAGVRTVEHGIFLDEEGLEALLEHGVALCPTLALYTAFARKGLEFGIPEDVVMSHRRTNEVHVQATRRAFEAGVTIIAGSDSGLANFPQGGGLEEICTYVEKVGMTPQEALLTATRDAASVIGFGDELGTLEAGKLADLLVLRESPLERIRSLTEPENLEAVVQGGRVVSGALPVAELQAV